MSNNKPRTFIRKGSLAITTAIRPEIDAEIRTHVPTVKEIISEIRTNFGLWAKTDKSYTRLLKRVVNSAYHNDAIEIIEEFALRMMQCANCPVTATIAVLKDICGVRLTRVKDDNGNLIAVKAKGEFTTPEQIRQMNATLSEDFIVKSYKRESAPKEKEDKLAPGAYAYLLNIIADTEKKIGKELEKGDNSHESLMGDFSTIRQWLSEQVTKSKAM